MVGADKPNVEDKKEGVSDEKSDDTRKKVKVAFVCSACGNQHDDCHQYMYGTFLVNDCISYFEDNSLDEVTDHEVIKDHYKYKYNQYLCFICHHDTRSMMQTSGMIRQSVW